MIRLSHCHHAPLMLVRTWHRGGVFFCTECKSQCKAMEAKSHCCLAEVIVSKDGFPFVCSLCEGACELGDPTTPTHEERIDGDILHILRQFGKGKISEKEAWNKLADILESERQSCEHVIIRGIQNTMRANLTHPEAKEPGTASHFLAGIDTSLAILDKIAEELLHEEEKME